MEYYFPDPKLSYLTSSLLYFLAAVVCLIASLLLENPYDYIFVPAFVITLGLSLYMFVKHLGEKERQFKIIYSLNVSGFTRQIGFNGADVGATFTGITIGDYYPVTPKDNSCKVFVTHPAKNAYAYHYKFLFTPKKDFVVIHDLEAVPELNDVRLFIKSDSEW